ncbi:MAG TPA: PASTA domain-containing protein [Candidatus Glassbacteria bacterium]|nr:PASTA domain-containing protein [Candidatus Glassbacteria bacterium]
MRGKLKTFTIYFVTAVVSFFFGLFVLDQVILPQLAGGGSPVEVPEVSGKRLEEARSVLAEAGLSLAVYGETFNSEVPAQYVLKQDPEPGVVVKRGRQVQLIVSLGPEIVTVPHLVGLTERQARILVERNMLAVAGIKSGVDPSMPRGRVLEVQPPAGTALARGSQVTLVVSQGAPKIRVPSLIDKTIDEARETLSALGLQIGQVSFRFNRYLPSGRIIDQNPLERTPVDKGASVDVVVATSNP